MAGEASGDLQNLILLNHLLKKIRMPKSSAGEVI